MQIWPLSVLLIFIVLIVISNRHKGYPRASRSRNIWFGPKPAHGENQIQHYLKGALYALACFVALALPMFFLSAPPDEGTSFRGNESVAEFAAWIIHFPLLAMAFVALATYLIKILFLSLFRPRHLFHQDLGQFIDQSKLRPFEQPGID